VRVCVLVVEVGKPAPLTPLLISQPTKIQNRHPPHDRPSLAAAAPPIRPVLGQRVRGADGHIVKQAEAVGARRVVGAGDHAGRAGVVPRRPHRAEGVAGGAVQDGVHSINNRARSDQGRIESLVAHRRVAVEVRQGGLPGRDGRAGGLQPPHVRPVVHAHHIARGRRAGGLAPGQAGPEEVGGAAEEAERRVGDDGEAVHILGRRVGARPCDGVGRRPVGRAGVGRDDEGGGGRGRGRGARIARRGEGGPAGPGRQGGRQGGVPALGGPGRGGPPPPIRAAAAAAAAARGVGRGRGARQGRRSRSTPRRGRQVQRCLAGPVAAGGGGRPARGRQEGGDEEVGGRARGGVEGRVALLVARLHERRGQGLLLRRLLTLGRGLRVLGGHRCGLRRSGFQQGGRRRRQRVVGRPVQRRPAAVIPSVRRRAGACEEADRVGRPGIPACGQGPHAHGQVDGGRAFN